MGKNRRLLLVLNIQALLRSHATLQSSGIPTSGYGSADELAGGKTQGWPACPTYVDASQKHRMVLCWRESAFMLGESIHYAVQGM